MRGQAAFEYLMLFSVALTMLAILVLYSQQMTERNREEIIIANAITAVNEIANTANIVYTQGEPSAITLDTIYIPERVSSIEFNNNMIIMKVNIAGGITDIFATSKAPLQGYISTESGIRKIKVKAEEDYVNITES